MSDDFGFDHSGPRGGAGDGGIGGRAGRLIVLIIFVAVAIFVIWFAGSTVLDLW
jgi:hypothetical protein